MNNYRENKPSELRNTLLLDELGRRIALGDFKELNIILKGDVDGSVEALSDQLQRLSTAGNQREYYSQRC